jgi:diaminopimelate epimerase
MIIPFTKMQGAGNDFVVIDETKKRYFLKPEQYRFLANRNFGVGADQILSVRPPPYEGVDFEYVIHNSDGSEVEHCGNGARCFVRFVHETGLTDKNPIRVKVQTGEIELKAQQDGRVRVDMGEPVFDLKRVPFDPQSAWPLPSKDKSWSRWQLKGLAETAQGICVLSMGNPHAVLIVDDTELAPVLTLGPQIEHHAAFVNRVNVGFMQILNRYEVKLRVFERGAGETLACGTGACAAVVSSIREGLLGTTVDVHTKGGKLTIEWAGMGKDAHQPNQQAPKEVQHFGQLVAQPNNPAHVYMTGPAVSVFKGEINLHE